MTHDELAALPDVTPQIVGHEIAPGVVVPKVAGGFSGALWQDVNDGEHLYRGDWYTTGWHSGVHVKRRSSYWSHV